MTYRKSRDYLQMRHAQKRGGGHRQIGNPRQGDGLAWLPDNAPTPELSAIIGEECQRLLSLLDDPILAEIAVLRLEGYTTHEIAAKIDKVPRTVERKSERIREIWMAQEPSRE
jgi:DNA-directed RNA polymerase specialized sigma24 family protein